MLWVGDNLTSIIGRFFHVPTQEDYEEQAESAKQSLIYEVENDASRIRKYMESCPDLSERLDAMATKIEQYGKNYQIPARMPEDYRLKISAEYQYEITTQSPRNPDPKVVGFVDLAVTVLVPQDVKFYAGYLMPCEIFSFGDSKNPNARDYEYAKELCDIDMGRVVTTKIQSEAEKIFFDVRPELPALGVLIRELKTLRELLGDHKICVVTMDEVPDRVASMLENEGFLILRRDQA